MRLGLFFLITPVLWGIAPSRDFSGKWVLASAGAPTPAPADGVLTVEQDDNEIRCSAGDAQWTYALNGTESKVDIGGDSRNSVAKWDGDVLTIDTIVSGAHDYSVVDRWKLSADRQTLTVARQLIQGVQQTETTLVYRRPAPLPNTLPRPAPPPSSAVRRIDPRVEPRDVMIPAGTHIPLTFRNTVDTRHSQVGERIYLQTEFPVTQGGRIVIPRGSFVNGVITEIRQPGHMGSKGELFIRFDTLTLPNGVSRDFRSRLGNDDEGKIVGQPDTASDTRKVTGAAGTGAAVGAMTHGAAGAGIGGAAAGIASVLLSRGADATLPQGTTVDMVLDRDLRFRADELRGN